MILRDDQIFVMRRTFIGLLPALSVFVQGILSGGHFLGVYSVCNINSVVCLTQSLFECVRCVILTA